MTTAKEEYRAFLDECKERYGFSDSEVVNILRDGGIASWRSSQVPQYHNLLNIKYLALEDERDKAKLQTYQPKPCPICGGQTRGTNEWFVRDGTRSESWECLSGGRGHYLQARTNQIMRRLGFSPAYEEVSNDTATGENSGT